MPTLDMTEGVYRRIYAGFLNNKKINNVSWMAEAWFWRLVVLADDYGNLDGNIRVLSVNAAPKRDVDAALAEKLTAELVKVKLIRLYEVDGDRYINIIGFEERQPANKNGRRIQRVPMPNKVRLQGVVNPGESGGIQNIPGESGGIRVNPGECSPSDSDSDSDSDSPPTPQGGVVTGDDTTRKHKRGRLIPDYTEKFQQFWSEYPPVRRVNKVGVFAKWQQQDIERSDKPVFELVMRGLAAWKKCHEWTKDGGQYVCMPLTFLNQRRWSNQPPSAPQEVIQ